MEDLDAPSLLNVLRLLTDPEFKEGYQDGHARRPRAYFTEKYLEGYRQGLSTAVIGTPDFRRSGRFSI